jgi:glycosyltransferase involved in cell wall biosynthesis
VSIGPGQHGGRPPQLEGLRVLHVVQKFSSGVGTAIAQYTRSLPGVEHSLLSTTAVDAEGDLAEQARFVGTYRMSGSPLAKIRRVEEVVRRLQPDVVHAHSSHGGAFTRLAISRRQYHIVYTPHCYAFERRDVHPLVRAVFWGAEAVLALNTSVFAACSARELVLSRWPTSRAPACLVPNVVPERRPAGRHRPGSPPTVAGGGRISAQKDPAFFAAAVAQMRRVVPDLRAVWLGDGDADGRYALEGQGIEVSGWLPRAAVLEELGRADLYLHSARWDGFPLMVVEAVALGVPTFVRAVHSFDSVPAELRMTGTEDVARAMACLHDGARARANTRLWECLLEDNTVDAQARALARAYTG